MALKQKSQKTFNLKRCPYCSVEIPVDALKCPNCKHKVGRVDRYGRAKEPIDWKAYTICVLSWIVFALVVWWGFLKTGQ